jgi:hypothetical protein
MPAGGTVTGTLPATTVYALIGCPDSTLNIGNFSAGYKAGVLGIISGLNPNTYGVFGNGGEAGVFGSGNLFGVRALGATAVYAESTGNVSISAKASATGDGVIAFGGLRGGSFDGSKIGVNVTTGGVISINGLPGNTSVGLLADAGFEQLNLSAFGDNQNIGLYAIAGSKGGRLAIGGIFAGGETGVLGSATTYGVRGSGEIGVLGSGTAFGVKGIALDGVYGETTSGSSGVLANGGGAGIGVSAYNARTGGNLDAFKTGVNVIAGPGIDFGSLPTNISVGLLTNAGFDLNLSTFSDNQNIGIYAIAGTRNGRTATAGVFSGNVNVYGTLTKAAGSFKIDHPLDPENKYLYHSFVESPT